jgi:DNA-binding GntR family transcriptional regulator
VDVAYEQIRRRILDNVWPPSHRALEQEVALALGMSRTPVREALVRLQNDGLVEVVPRHGMRVLPVSPTDMREIYEILTALECMAAELLARRTPGEDELQPLVDATKAMDKALKADDLDAWATAIDRFNPHLSLAFFQFGFPGKFYPFARQSRAAEFLWHHRVDDGAVVIDANLCNPATLIGGETDELLDRLGRDDRNGASEWWL